MESASRTLVKSPPELWELLDTPERMQGLMSSLVGHATEIEVLRREQGAYLGWEARAHGEGGGEAGGGAGERPRIEIAIAEKGWGTHVELSAECGGEGKRLEGWLEAVMDELATPSKRPFGGVV